MDIHLEDLTHMYRIMRLSRAFDEKVMQLFSQGETRTMTPGDFYIVPGGVVHSALAGPDGFVAYEVFSPVREDLKY